MVVEFRAENFKRLKVVQFKPNKGVQIIGGRNAQGKTSVLDSVFSALAGATASRQIAEPVRAGQDHAEVELDMGQMVVTRTWKDGKSSLVVKSKLGAKFSSPQKLMDEMLGRLSFDPLDFTRLEPKAQINALMDIIGLGDTLTDLGRRRESAYSARTEVGRKVKELEASLAQMGLMESSVNPVSLADLLAEYQFTKATEDKKIILETSLQDVREQIAQLLVRQTALEHELASIPTPPVSAESMRQTIDKAEEINSQAHRNQARSIRSNELLDCRGEYDRHALTITVIDQEKVDVLASANFPIAGLGFNEEGVTFNGIPFTQCSASEQIRVSLAMAMALSPTIRVIFIRDGSLLDDESMAQVEAMAQKGYQVWVERVGDADGVGVVIEDGEVA